MRNIDMLVYSSLELGAPLRRFSAADRAVYNKIMRLYSIEKLLWHL